MSVLLSGLIFYFIVIGKIERGDKQGSVVQKLYLLCSMASVRSHVVRVKGGGPMQPAEH